MAVACAGIMTIAHSLVGARVAVLSGLAFFRSVATRNRLRIRGSFVCALGRSCDVVNLVFAAVSVRPTPHQSLGVCYGLSLVVTGYVFLYGQLIVVVHLLVAASDSTTRHRVRALLLIQGGVALITIPLAVLAWRERGESSWIPSGFFTMITNGVGVFVTPFWSGMATSPFPELLALLVWGLIAWGLLRLIRGSAWSARAQMAVRLGLAWALVPGALFSLASAVGPYFTLRYLVFCAPALALLFGLAVDQFHGVIFRGGLILVLAVLISLADAPLISNAGKDGWGTTLEVLTTRGTTQDFVLPTPQHVNDFVVDALVTGLPHEMTLIDGGYSFHWPRTHSIRRWTSSSPPPTHVIWLVAGIDQIGCSELALLRH